MVVPVYRTVHHLVSVRVPLFVSVPVPWRLVPEIVSVCQRGVSVGEGGVAMVDRGVSVVDRGERLGEVVVDCCGRQVAGGRHGGVAGREGGGGEGGEGGGEGGEGGKLHDALNRGGEEGDVGRGGRRGCSRQL